jgi:hypothetical protein
MQGEGALLGRVLRFDPSIGAHGAFVVSDVPRQQQQQQQENLPSPRDILLGVQRVHNDKYA